MTRPESIDAQALVDPETGQPAAGAPLGAVLSAHAALTPDHPAVTFGARTTSFAELDAMANRRARQLAELGIGQDDRVIVVLPNSLEFIECVFAVWKLGASACPISHRLTPAEFAAIVELQQGADPPDEHGFLASLHERLVGFKRPRSVEFTCEWIRDDAGKVRRSTLREARLAVDSRKTSVDS
jgi:acyl-CoA synthetase (AMP-forming)/AMP-acid ligase II